MPEIQLVEDDLRAPLTAFLSIAAPDGTTRFVNQIVEKAPPELTFRYFSWMVALFGRYDVFHIHWPEFIVRHKNPVVQFARSVMLQLLLLKLKARRIPIVRTLHNLKPHEDGGLWETQLLARLDRQVALYIRLSEATPLGDRTGATILHGHYQGRYKDIEGIVPEAGRILYFGLIRPYKGVDNLLQVFSSIDDRDLTLRLVGKPDKGYRELIEEYCRNDPRISSDLAFVPDDRLAQNILAAELVVLPYKEMHNSGAILVALSLARPVLVPRSRNNELLAEEIGPGWVYMFDGELTEQILRERLAHVRGAIRRPPHLNGRDWDVVGEAHYRAYRAARAILRGHAPPLAH